jgi:uncharacterized phiE125 gp8 family phage protein
VSSIKKTDLDLTTLPAALLPLAKSHLRVDGTFDDAYITSAIARGISWFERVTNVSVNPVTWLWSPDRFVDGLAPVPVSPVDTFMVDAGGDVSADFSIVTLSTYGVGIYALSGAYVSGMVVTIPTGYADATALDPGILDAVLRYTAHLYENREILVAGSEATTPGWMTDTISTYWMPRA